MELLQEVWSQWRGAAACRPFGVSRRGNAKTRGLGRKLIRGLYQLTIDATDLLRDNMFSNERPYCNHCSCTSAVRAISPRAAEAIRCSEVVVPTTGMEDVSANKSAN